MCINIIRKSYLQVVQELHMYHHNKSADLCQMKNLQEKGTKLSKCREKLHLDNIFSITCSSSSLRNENPNEEKQEQKKGTETSLAKHAFGPKSDFMYYN